MKQNEKLSRVQNLEKRLAQIQLSIQQLCNAKAAPLGKFELFHHSSPQDQLLQNP